jgi:hypothetical protein
LFGLNSWEEGDPFSRSAKNKIKALENEQQKTFLS